VTRSRIPSRGTGRKGGDSTIVEYSSGGTLSREKRNEGSKLCQTKNEIRAVKCPRMATCSVLTGLFWCYIWQPENAFPLRLSIPTSASASARTVLSTPPITVYSSVLTFRAPSVRARLQRLPGKILSDGPISFGLMKNIFLTSIEASHPPPILRHRPPNLHPPEPHRWRGSITRNTRGICFRKDC